MKYFFITLIFISITITYAQIPDIYLQPISINNDINNPEAILEIKLRTGQNNITNPIIIAEGFDPGAILSPENLLGDSDLESFDREINNAGNNLRNLVDPTFINHQYDIIYINWNKGTDAIQNNSEVLEAVIDWVNNEKTTDEEIVLLGQSMGGVIGRYTLARMEQEDPNYNPNNPATSPHQVRLLIMHDSPLQGSNTPISTQHFSRHIHNLYVSSPTAYILGEYLVPLGFGLAEITSSTLNFFGANTSVDPYVTPDSYLTVQDTPAALQLNYWWVDFGEEAKTDFHDAWQQEFNQMGYPHGSRNIAISNGNVCPTDNEFDEGDLLLTVDDLDDPDVFGDLVHSISTPIIGQAFNNLGLQILGTIPGASRWFYDFDLHSNPDGGGKTTYYGRVKYEKTILWIVKSSVNLTYRNINSPSGLLPFGTFSGGTFDVENVVEDLPSQFPSVTLVNRFYGFIPTVSALDVQRNNNPVPFKQDYLRSYGGGEINDSFLSSPLDNFIVDFQPNNPINFEHISFQTRNGNWLAAEINENPNIIGDCSFICGNQTIFGPEIICSSTTYSYDNAPNNTTWSLTPSNAGTITVNSNTTITVNPDNNFRGSVILEADVFSTECGGGTIPKDLHFGGPTGSATVNGDTELDPGPTDAAVFYIDTNNFESFTYINWVVFSYSDPNAAQYFTLNPQQGDGSTVVVTANSNTPAAKYYIQARVGNVCGFLSFDKAFRVNDDGPPVINPFKDEGTTYTIFPNPAQNVVNIAPKDDTTVNSADRNAKVIVYDARGTERFSTRLKNHHKRFTVGKFGSGTYIVTLFLKDGEESHQLIIE